MHALPGQPLEVGEADAGEPHSLRFALVLLVNLTTLCHRTSGELHPSRRAVRQRLDGGGGRHFPRLQLPPRGGRRPSPAPAPLGASRSRLSEPARNLPLGDYFDLPCSGQRTRRRGTGVKKRFFTRTSREQAARSTRRRARGRTRSGCSARSPVQRTTGSSSRATTRCASETPARHTHTLTPVRGLGESCPRLASLADLVGRRARPHARVGGGAAAVPLPARRGALPQRARPQRAPAALSSLSCGGEIRRDRPQIGARLGAAQPVDKRRCERRPFTAPAVNYRRSTSLSREPSRTSTRGAPITPRPQTHCGPTRRPLDDLSPLPTHTRT